MKENRRRHEWTNHKGGGMESVISFPSSAKSRVISGMQVSLGIWIFLAGGGKHKEAVFAREH